MTLVHCNHCGEDKAENEFYPVKRGGNRLRPRCKSCVSVANRKWREANPERHRKLVDQWHEENPERRRLTRFRSTLRSYGLTISEYDSMVDAQHGVCAICQQPESTPDNLSRGPRRLTVDHCHETGRVRGLLCQNCNSGIGQLGDSVQRLEAALAYLRADQERP